LSKERPKDTGSSSLTGPVLVTAIAHVARSGRECSEKSLGFFDLRKFRGRRKTFERGGEDVVRFEGAVGRLIQPRQRQRRAQLHRTRALFAGDGDGRFQITAGAIPGARQKRTNNLLLSTRHARWRTAACKLAVITHTGSLGISPARNPASRLGYGRASADPISAGATIYSYGLVPNAIPKKGGRSAAHHGQCRKLLRWPAVLEGDNGRTARPQSWIEKPRGG
jgi:hypothetical protein